MLLLTPALVLAPLPPDSAFDFDQFRTTRLLPDSSQELVQALVRLYQDSSAFAAILGRLTREEPRSRFRS